MAKVLAVDDDHDLLDILRRALEAAGHQTAVCADPRETVSKAIEHDADIILLDVTMPQQSGFEVIESLRDHPQTSALPVLFLSGKTSSEDRIRGLKLGGDDYLVKPFALEELVLRVERLTARSRLGRAEVTPTRTLKEAIALGDFHSSEVFLGRYRAHDLFGEGASGVVLRGWDPTLRRSVALKTVRLDRIVGDVGPALRRLLDEASMLARFNHPNIVAIYDAGASDDIAYIVMEAVEGSSLQTKLSQSGHLGAARTIEIGIAVARGLSVAHAASIVHRDVTPSNLLLGRTGTIKVTDFGLANLVDAVTVGDYKVQGTPGFVAPEVLVGGEPSPAADVFALGAVLYECVTAARAFVGENPRVVMRSTLAGPPVSPRVRQPETPPALSGLVIAMLSTRPNDRPSASDVEHRLMGLRESVGVSS